MPILRRIGSGKRNRAEVRILIAVTLIILFLGAGYTLFFGSPQRGRAEVDSPYANTPLVQKPSTRAAPKP